LVSCLLPGQELNLEAGDEFNWSQLVLGHKQGSEIALIEKDSASPGSLGEAEIAEFVDEVRDEKPASAARWLSEFLPRVRVIYAHQLLSGTDVADGWTGVRAIQGRLRNKSGGILQADMEGFSNEDGYHILWQFERDHDSAWAMAVLNEHGDWEEFEMKLNNAKHKRAFLQGRIPEGVKLLK
jgi:hypothetical protein